MLIFWRIVPAGLAMRGRALCSCWLLGYMNVPGYHILEFGSWKLEVWLYPGTVCQVTRRYSLASINYRVITWKKMLKIVIET